MQPKIGDFIADGASRHRLRKGVILISADEFRREATREHQSLVVRRANNLIEARAELEGYTVAIDKGHQAVVYVVTPMSTVHTPVHRQKFFEKLASALICLAQAAAEINLKLIGAGMNPFKIQESDQPPALCADIHEIEVLDDLEINRIYNLFRQYLPELLAISSHSALYNGNLQKDLSTRMRHNPTSFTPPSLTLFSSRQLDRLKRAVRKDFGLGDLTQLDVNPVSPNVIVLRFIDAQTSLQFIRAQVLLFQAIAVHGRMLARQGSQIPVLHSRVIGANKALAIEAGPGAIFKPDRRREIERKTAWYQDRQAAERASTTLLEMLHHQTIRDSPPMIKALQTLKADYIELLPFLLGAELRKRGEACLVNYSEYQLWLFHTNKQGWASQLISDYDRMLFDANYDWMAEFNKTKFPELKVHIGLEWRRYLTPQQNSGPNQPPPRRFQSNRQNDKRKERR